jgi:hypothetical protein
MTELKLPNFQQIGIVVRDIELAKQMYAALLNFEKDLKIFEQDTSVVYKGKEVNFKLKKIQQNWGDKQLEIVEVAQSDGDHLYSDFIKEGKEGLHHLGIYSKDAESYIKYFKEKYDIDVIQTGQLGRRVKFYYLDTVHTLGFYLELISF